MTDETLPEANQPETEPQTDAENPAAEAAPAPEPEAETEEPREDLPAPQPAPHLERLQKILAQAGISSRRHAETLITEGRVQVNGKVVTELGTKADPVRDHIRVDGKLLHGAERLRYFMLNKPRGYVTTVKDPEGRPTVMEFFSKTGERLYPVGRLDYLSEGLLIVTNDGELANGLTRAAAGVEKTYLVKVSGQPTEEELETLRSGVSIERGKPGEGRVRTAPAQIRQVRQGDNPWYEVVLIEGRNRELRKMFEEIGHFVEKIRRVGYGPLVLDMEPGKFRELEPEEVATLRLAAEGKLKPRRLRTTRMLPREAGRSAESRSEKARGGKFAREGSARPTRPTRARGEQPPTERRTEYRTEERRPSERRSDERRPVDRRPDDRRTSERPAGRRFSSESAGGERPAWKKSGPAAPKRAYGERAGGERAGRERVGGERPYKERPSGERSYTARPYPERPSRERPYREQPRKERPYAERPYKEEKERGWRDRPAPAADFTPRKPSRLNIEPIESERPVGKPSGEGKPGFGRPVAGRPSTGRPSTGRPSAGKFGAGKFGAGRPGLGKSGPARSGFDRPAPPRRRDEDREFEGARSERPRFERRGPGKPSFDRPASSRPRPERSGERPGRPPARTQGGGERFRPEGREEFGAHPTGQRPAGKAGWKPKPSFGGKGKAGSGKPAAGGPPKRAFGAKAGRSKTGGFKAGGARPGGSKTGGSKPGGSRPGGSKAGGFKSGGSKAGGFGRSSGSRTRPGGKTSGGFSGKKRRS